MNPNVKSKRNAMLAKVFCAAAEHGLTAEFVRDVIAPNQIKKRLSAASEQEIAKVITCITGEARTWNNRKKTGAKKYPSSMQGLRDEIKDLAIQRWGDGWSISLNSLCKKFGVDHYNFLDLSHGKAVKQRLIAWSMEQSAEGKGGWGDEPLPEKPPF